ncbi:MAG: bifunctional hydroxymethylpyrimidine kinase/phosphomethylpyrimidine kinase [Rhizobiales bacterium]|nr:bifunctional hydroxymethylpyrimidine kinase/phosphomethylpyrimidine kinase [Hyphomicrobiales bacterium]
MSPTPAVLVISSQVAAGPVGASAAAPALLSLGVIPIVVPTILFTNHPGHGRPEGTIAEAATVGAMLHRLMELGFLEACRCVLSGYFANTEQVVAAADFIAAYRASNPDIYYLCDPIVGDDGELYVKQDIAEAIRDRLVPMAQGLTPNAFEAAWMSDMAIRSTEDARLASRIWPDKDVIVTSIPEGDDRLTTAVFGHGEECIVSRPRLSHVPHGIGDLLSGLAAGHIARGEKLARALPEMIDTLDRVIAASEGSDSLDLARGLKP